MRNLLKNAYEHGAGENGKIEIGLRSKNGKNLIWIKDYGAGIPADILPKVGNVFYRGPGKTQGSGLGIYTSKVLSDEFNASVRIFSKENEGTAAFLYLR